MDRRDRKWLALVCSFVLPGLGQVYNRELPKAFLIWAVLGIAVIAARPPMLAALPQPVVVAGALVALAAYVLNVYDAYSNGGKR